MAIFDKGFKATVIAEAGEDAMWARMRELQTRQDGFTVLDVLKGIRQRRDTIAEFVRRLEAGGFVIRTGSRPTETGLSVVYALATKRIATPKVNRDGTERPEPKNQVLWRAMKILGRFTASELTEAASTPERPISLLTVKTYLKHLKRVRVVTASPNRIKNREVYRLAKNLGAQAPRILSAKMVLDPNRHVLLDDEITAQEVSE